ncbi:hypothetical protein GCM10010975_18340 [Comamonas phosphati]|nr:hypothetical protein GCM10010975_18340 [Comamonas phosphati]
MKQPILGGVATALVLVLSLCVVWLLGLELFMGWASYALMCAIPFAIVCGAFWHGEEPRPIAGWPQPLRGLAYLVLAALVGAVVAIVHWQTRGGGIHPPVPMAVMTIITSVVTAFFLTIVFGGWPFTRIPNRLAGGLALLLSVYLVNAAIFHLFFDFGFAAGAPWYSARLDPAGLFNAWDVVVLMVTSLAVMFVFLFLDLWPLTAVPALRSQPALGLVWLVCCLGIGWGIFRFGTQVLGLPAPSFMVQVPIPFIFGAILMLNMLGGSLLPKLPQPARGLVGVVIAALLGAALSRFCAALMPLLSGPLPSGPEGNFAAEVWLANALLAVTFPFLAFYGDFFGLWPLAARPQAGTETKA